MTKDRYNANRFAANRFKAGRYRGTSGTREPDFMHGRLFIRATVQGEMKLAPSVEGDVRVNK